MTKFSLSLLFLFNFSFSMEKETIHDIATFLRNSIVKFYSIQSTHEIDVDAYYKAAAISFYDDVARGLRYESGISGREGITKLNLRHKTKHCLHCTLDLSTLKSFKCYSNGRYKGDVCEICVGAWILLNLKSPLTEMPPSYYQIKNFAFKLLKCSNRYSDHVPKDADKCSPDSEFRNFFSKEALILREKGESLIGIVSSIPSPKAEIPPAITHPHIPPLPHPKKPSILISIGHSIAPLMPDSKSETSSQTTDPEQEFVNTLLQETLKLLDSTVTIERYNAKEHSLDLAHLNLNEIDPVFFEKLNEWDPELRKLILYGNNLTNLPETIEKLRNLKELDLRNNPLISLPEATRHLTDIEILLLGRTSLKTLPIKIGRLKNLQHLDLTDCKLLTSLPDSLFTVPNLQGLVLDENRHLILTELQRNSLKACGILEEKDEYYDCYDSYMYTLRWHAIGAHEDHSTDYHIPIWKPRT